MLFISPQKLFLFSRYLSFCLGLLVVYQNGLIKKIRSISVFLMSQPHKKTIVIHILPNISKGNQTMKFGQLIECNMKNILKNYTQNVVEKLVRKPFLKNQNWAYLWVNSLKFYTVCFYCIASWGLSKHIKTKLQATGFLSTHISLYQKIKTGLELVFLPYFPLNF